LVIDKSALGGDASTSVAVLLLLLGSVIPPGAAIDALLLRVPEAEAGTVPCNVKVTLLPDARLTLELILPVPLAGLQLAAGEQLHVTLVRILGTVSVIVAPVTADGPALVATMV